MIDVGEILKLSKDEKVQLIDVIWESIESGHKEIPIPEWQFEEINKRLANIDSGKSKSSTWDEVKAFAKEGL